MTTLDQALSDLRAAHEEIAGLKKDHEVEREAWNRVGIQRAKDRDAALARLSFWRRRLLLS